MRAQRRAPGFRLGAVAAALLAVAGCRTPPRPYVNSVEVEGLKNVDPDEIEDGLSTSESPRLFGLFKGVLEYSTYDRNVLARDLQRVERALRARGYYEAKVTSARVIFADRYEVNVRIRVHEGRPVRVRRIDPGLSRLPFEVMLDANAAREMADGDVFDEARFEADKARVERVLRDGGYAFAKVEAKARVDLAAHVADVTYTIDLGGRARYGPVTFIGLTEIPEGPVRENLELEEGALYSESDVEDAQRALVNLGVFSTVEVVPDRSRPETGIVPIQVRVRESSLRTLRVGGGARFDVLRLSTQLQTGWEHRNFLGGLRAFRVDARPGVTLFPTRIDRLEPWTAYLLEHRLRAELRQPSFLEGRTTGFLAGEYNVYPLLYPLPDDAEPGQERIIGYHEIRASAGVERAFFGHHLRVRPSYNWQANYPFTYQREEPPGFPSVQISFPELRAELDFRDDPVRTRRGVYLSNTLQVAGHPFAGTKLEGTVSDVLVRPELRTFLPIKSAVLAARFTFGFLFPDNYGGSLDDETFDAENAETIADQQKLRFRAFYSGGPTSNRGYPIDGVGPHGPIGFLVPTGVDCNLPRPATDPDIDPGCIRALGGLSLWEASLEARIPFPFDAPLDGVLFVDASDITRRVLYLRTNVPHLSPGFGLRYATPIGPVRLDVGWRVPTLQALGESELPESEGRPGRPLLGFFPGAVHLAIGEAF